MGLETSPPDLNSCRDLQSNYDQTFQWVVLLFSAVMEKAILLYLWIISVLSKSSFPSVMLKTLMVTFIAFPLIKQ